MFRRTFGGLRLIAGLGIGVTLLLIGIAALSQRQQAAAQAAAAPTSLSLSVPEGVKAGDPITVRLVVDNARNLAGFQATIAYDPAQLRLIDVVFHDELSRSGRDLLPLGPVRRDGAVVLGAATCPVDRCEAALGEAVTRQDQGVYGRVELASLSFLAASPGNYALGLDGTQLVDPNGNLLDAVTLSGMVPVGQP